VSRFKPTPAFVIALVALVFATAGGAVAATQITGSMIARGTITGKNVKNDSLTPTDFRGSVRGPRGRQGAQGAQGPPGPTALGQVTTVTSAQVPYGPSDTVQTAIAFCPTGQRAISGGGANVADEQLAASIPSGARSGWGVIGVDLVDNGGEYVQAYALCAPAGQAVAAKAPVSRADVRRHFAELEAHVLAHRR
jgi:hypothetical protein